MVNEKKLAVPAEAAEAKDVRRIDVRTLLDGQRELLLEHEGQTYHLRITANGKLILTK